MKKFILPLLLLIGFSSYSQIDALTVIGNNNAVSNQLSFSGLKSIFMGEQPKWSSGDKVVIALMKVNTEAGKITCSRLYGMSSADVTKHWVSVSLKGNLDAPVFFNSTNELQTFVSNTKGAIGIINEPVSASNAKTVLIDGKKTF